MREVKIGDIVTFRGKHHREIKAEVKSVLDDGYCMVRTVDLPYTSMKKHVSTLHLVEDETDTMERQREQFERMIHDNFWRG